MILVVQQPHIVVMEMLGIPQLQSLLIDVASKSFQNITVVLGIHLRLRRHLVLVNKALHVKKSDHHDLALGFLLANFLHECFVFPLPELTLSFGQRIEVRHPCFIRDYDAIEVVCMIIYHP